MIEYPKLIYEKIKLPFIKAAINLGLNSIQISILNHFLTLTFGCYFFSRGQYIYYLAALGVCLINGFLDYLDGDLARAKKETSQVGAWLDSGFDVVIQNAVLGAIAIGCFKEGMSLFWIVMFFIGNSSCNFVSFYYNQRFGFDSSVGNKLFREFMDKSNSRLDAFFKKLIDPTSDASALVLYTFRYYIALGCVLNIMPKCFLIMTLITNFRWFLMYCIYALYLNGNRGLYVLKALSILDEESNEFYKLREGG